jgi:predicted dithiol-disulfide oxidoreductase (DUF899 family)
MNLNEIQALEKEIYEKTEKLNALKGSTIGVEVKNYSFQNLEGEVSLKQLFGSKEKLIVIQNMGQGCRYCTLWADGLNAFLPHLESSLAVALVSKDDPETQRKFANSRSWRFRLYSHKNSDYLKEQGASSNEENGPGIVCYELRNGKIFKKNSSPFGPNDLFCSIWNILAMAGYTEDNWSPQYNYWKRPDTMDDGGQNLVD